MFYSVSFSIGVVARQIALLASLILHPVFCDCMQRYGAATKMVAGLMERVDDSRLIGERGWRTRMGLGG